jgi:hypothetical protein
MRKLGPTHDILLHLLDELPGPEASELRTELKSLFQTLSRQLDELQLTSQSYEAVAGKIRAKASLRKRKLASRLKEDDINQELCLDRQGNNC